MARLKVLFADDQIPDEDISDAGLASALNEKYPDKPPGFRAGFLPMRQAVKKLRDGGYEVTVARTYQEALDSIEATHFDVAIVDMGWSGDLNLPSKFSDSAGWAICDAIEEADKGTGPPPTFQMVYSNRFDENPDLAQIAVDKSKMPFFKTYSEAFTISLLAAVKYIEKIRSNPSARDLALERARDAQKMVKESFDAALKQERRWTTITIGLVTTSIILILVGALAAILGYAQAGILTAISSTITAAISALLFGHLKTAQENTRESREAANRNYEKAMEQLFSQAPAGPKT